jgi:plastocyanin
MQGFLPIVLLKFCSIEFMRKSIVHIWLLWAVCVVAIIITGSAKAATFTVQTVGFTFSPPSITIGVGDTITWVTQPALFHDVEADDGTFKSPPPGSFSTFSFTFTQAKTIAYHCNPHASLGMRGTIIVQAPQNQPPGVTLSGPPNGATFNPGDTITISANASDPDGSIAKVEFFDGGNLLGTSTAAPYSISVTLGLGQHTLTAKATDNAGASASSGAATITVNPPANQPPLVQITSPPSGATFNAGETITMVANASDPDGSIAKVEFFDGGNLLGTATTSPFSVSVTLGAGQHNVTAKATDNAGASSNSGAIAITVNSPANQIPTVELTSPPLGAVFNPGDAITFSANASDPDGSISKVEFFENGNSLGSVTAPPYSISTTLPPGPHTLFATATDNAGATANSASLVITVNQPGNQSPNIILTSPASGASFNVGDPITISVDATDPDGSISKVEFYDAGNLIGTATTPPYSISINLPLGQHSLSARATDDKGFGATTAPITISVNQAGNHPPTVVLTSPTNGASFNPGDTITLSADAADSDGTIARVEFLVDGGSVGTSEAAPFSIPFTVSAGQHTITAIATDNLGASTTSESVTITVNAVANNPPTVSILYPADNSAYEFPATLTMEARAEDTDGTITKVEFFDGLGSIGIVTNPPYAMTFTLSATRHAITAVATDNSGASTTSAIVHLNVARRPTLHISRTSQDTYQLTGEATPAVPYTIQASSDLRNWSDLATITPLRGGRIDFTDTVTPDQPFKTYRVIVK